MRLRTGIVGLVLSVLGALGLVAVPAGAHDVHEPHPPHVPPPTASSCDPIDTRQCLLPFPDDFFTVADRRTATGRRVHFDPSVMPANASGTPVDPTDWNRNDGFSPGSLVMVSVPGLDVARSGFAPITDIGRSLRPDAPAVLFDTDTHQRVPYWAELDTWNPDPATRALVIRPARNYAEGHHIVVALRNLVDSSGRRIAAPAGFTALRDDRATTDRALFARRYSLDRVFADLAPAGVRRRDLYLAWDFTVASASSLAGGMLHMRDDAYSALGNAAPTFTVTHVDENVSADVLRRVQGTVDVPQYLTGDGSAGTRLALGPDGLPQRTGTYHAEFRCLIPRAVVGADGSVHPARAIVYGHGLLGSTDEIEGYGPLANQFDLVICATPWIGMASDDVANVVHVITDFSTFGSIPDRLQQSLLDFQFLARVMKDANGFDHDPAFRVGASATGAIAPGAVFYNGNSQGGILGGAATAISKEWTRAVLGVPGMNYSELLPRSVDFDPFLALLSGTYPDARYYTLLVALGQMLWDRGDADGYAQHMISNPYPGTPNHTVLMIEAFGDHQVANISTETEARTIGAFVRKPALAPGRSNDVSPFWGLAPVPASPFHGSVLEVWDFGTPAPPVESVPPESPQYGSDPHGAARNVPAVRQQVSEFLQTGGAFVDVCGANPCHP